MDGLGQNSKPAGMSRLLTDVEIPKQKVRTLAELHDTAITIAIAHTFADLKIWKRVKDGVPGTQNDQRPMEASGGDIIIDEEVTKVF